jgi:hypothetical protein
MRKLRAWFVRLGMGNEPRTFGNVVSHRTG